MNLRGLFVICGIIAVTALVGSLALTQKNVLPSTPSIVDTVNVSDESKITVDTASDSLMESDVVPHENVIEQHIDAEYWLDENGVKHYVIYAVDSPSFGK